MSSSKITELSEVTIVDALNDYLVIVDVSDTTMAVSGTTKKVKPTNMPVSSGVQTALDAKVTGISSSTSGRLPLFDGTSGKLLKEYTETGIVKVTSGVPTAVTAPTGLILGDSDSQVVSNKRINTRVFTVTSTGTATPDITTTDDYVITAQSGSLTLSVPTGTPLQGQRLMYVIGGNNTSSLIQWNAIYRAISVTLPTGTIPSGVIYAGMKYASTANRWDVLAIGSGV
jgi:hypothetical protein